MFYDTFLYLCNQNNISPSAAALDMGFQKSVVTRWKGGTIPRDANLQKVADYFGVSVDYLLNGETKKSPAVKTEDDELSEYLEELKNREEMRMLFSLAKNATKEDVQRAVAIIEALRGQKGD